MNNNLYYFLTANNCCSEIAKNIYYTLETGLSNYIINGDFVIIKKDVEGSRYGLIFLCEDTTSKGIVYKLYKKTYSSDKPQRMEFQLRECLKNNGVSESDVDFIVGAIYTKQMQVVTQTVIVCNWDMEGSHTMHPFVKKNAGIEIVDDVYMDNYGTYNNYNIYLRNSNPNDYSNDFSNI